MVIAESLTYADVGNSLLEGRKRFLRFAMKLTKDYDGAEDCIQEASLNIHNQGDSLITGENPEKLVYKIIVNTFSKKPQNYSSKNVLWDPFKEDFYSFEDASINNLFIDELFFLIDKLPEVYSETLKLYSLGLGYAEVAEELNIPKGTVKSRISRARTELETLILEKFGTSASGLFLK